MLATNLHHLPISFVAMWGTVTEDDVEGMRRYYDECHRKGGRFVSLVDSRRSSVPTAPIRRALTDMSNTFHERSVRNTVCVAVVLDSKVLIGVLSALRWFLKTDADLRYFPTAAEALAWGAERLAAEKLTVPAGAGAVVAWLDSVPDLSGLSER
ncbi:MAG: hypothetical protein Q8O67_18765 [Deltaproteobacteria bacterium]|nr:hypothetical protein [Deltaproteobacteria bacterium]